MSYRKKKVRWPRRVKRKQKRKQIKKKKTHKRRKRKLKNENTHLKKKTVKSKVENANKKVNPSDGFSSFVPPPHEAHPGCSRKWTGKN